MQQINNEQVFLEDIQTPFNPLRFSIPREPISLGFLPISFESFAKELPSCLDMTIKLAGKDQLIVPEPYKSHRGIQNFLAICNTHEKKLLGEKYLAYYSYLTVDNRLVHIGKTHRNAGWHFDGMQGSRYKTKLKACHQYVVSDCLPTEFACGSYNASKLDEAKHNWFAELGKQVKNGDPRYFPRSMEVVLMSAYQLHRSVVAKFEQKRMFMRLDYSLKQQDRLGNTINPVLKTPWKYVVRPMPEHLQIPVSDTGWST